jgi:hypothetical protein
VGEICHTEKVVVLVNLLKQLDKVLKVLVRGMAFLDGGVQNGCQALVLLHEAGPGEVVSLLVFWSPHETGLLQNVSGRSLVHHALEHGPDALHGFHAPGNNFLDSVSRPRSRWGNAEHLLFRNGPKGILQARFQFLVGRYLEAEAHAVKQIPAFLVESNDGAFPQRPALCLGIAFGIAVQ